MTTAVLRDLVRFHEETAANQFELAKGMLDETAEQFRANGAKHLKWAEELRRLISAAEVFAEIFHS